MSVYTVHEPPQRDAGASVDPDRFVFVRDGFYFWAMVFGPIWLLWRRLWLALLFYVIAWVAVEGSLWRSRRAQPRTAPSVFFLRSCSAWKPRACGAGRSIAAAGKISASSSATILNPPNGVSSRAGASSRKRHRAPKTSVLTSYGPKSSENGNDVIGLFPEPGGSR